MNQPVKFKNFKHLIRKNNPTILEIGSHTGSDTVRLLQAFNEAKIYCFEPNPRVVSLFKKYINSDNVLLEQIAIFDEDIEEKEFFISHETMEEDYFVKNKKSILRCEYSYSFTKDDFFKFKLNRSAASSLKRGYVSIDNTESVKVRCMKLDTWAEKSNVYEVDLLWIDVQGAEKNVIDGAKEILENTNFVWIEYGETEYDGGLDRNQTIQLLEQNNFICLEQYSDTGAKGDLLFKNRIQHNLGA